jgi:hypothetical protein
MFFPNKNSEAESSPRREVEVNHDKDQKTYLEINWIASSEPFLHLPDRDMSMLFEIIKITNSITAKEGSGHRAVKSVTQ